MTNLHDFLNQLSSGDPVPGGGSVAALQAAMAASLIAMVANLTIGRKKYADYETEARTILDRATKLRQRAESLADEDVQAYGGVAEAMNLPRDTDEQKTARREHVQIALKAAAGPPLETMQVACEIVRLANRMAQIGNRSAISDVGTAALSARAAYHAARLNVEINVASVRDEAWVRSMQEALAALASPDDAERSILAATEAVIRGTAA